MVSADLVIVLKRIETNQYQYKELEWHVGTWVWCSREDAYHVQSVTRDSGQSDHVHHKICLTTHSPQFS